MNRLLKFAFLPILVLGLLPAAWAHDKITTIVGGGPNGLPGTSVNLPLGQIALDAEGNLYIVTSGIFTPSGPSNSGAVYKLNHGKITLIAGDGTYNATNSSTNPAQNYHGDTGLATHIELTSPVGIAVDGASPANVYIADSGNCVVLKLDQTTGLVSNAFGSPSTDPASSGANCLPYPEGLAADPRNGDLYVGANGPVYRVTGGDQNLGVADLAATDAEGCSGYPGGDPNEPPYVCSEAIALDTSVTPANVYIALTCRVDEYVGATGKLFTVAGSSTQCGFKDNVPATQGLFNSAEQIYVVGNGTTATVRVADTNNWSIRQFTVSNNSGVPSSGVLTTIAGTTVPYTCNPSATTPLGTCMTPVGLAGNANGTYNIANSMFGSVEQVTAGGALSETVGWALYPQIFISNPEVLSNSRNVPALYAPSAVFADPASNTLYLSNFSNVYVWNSTTDRISDLAGNGIGGFAGDGKLASDPSVKLSIPGGMAKDAAGNLYIADTGNCRVRIVSSQTGIISTYAGNAFVHNQYCGYGGDSGPALDAQLNRPAAVAFDANGNLVIADTANNLIRKVDHTTHIITTIAGVPNTAGFSGDGGPATEAALSQPQSVSCDGAGNLYIADSNNAAIREVYASSGIIQTVAGVGGSPGFNGDGGDVNGTLVENATSVQFSYPYAVKADRNGNLFVSDSANALLRWITPAGQVITFAGTPPPIDDFSLYQLGFEGDGGLATRALLYEPQGIDQDIYGNFDFADSSNNRIRQISAFPGFGLSTVGLTFSPQAVGTASAAQTIIVSAIGPIKFGAISLTGGFKETDNCTHTELNAGQTCEIQVTYRPVNASGSGGTLKLYSNALLTGDGTGLFNGNPDEVTLTVGEP